MRSVRAMNLVFESIMQGEESRTKYRIDVWHQHRDVEQLPGVSSPRPNTCRMRRCKRTEDQDRRSGLCLEGFEFDEGESWSKLVGCGWGRNGNQAGIKQGHSRDDEGWWCENPPQVRNRSSIKMRPRSRDGAARIRHPILLTIKSTFTSIFWCLNWSRGLMMTCKLCSTLFAPLSVCSG